MRIEDVIQVGVALDTTNAGLLTDECYTTTVTTKEWLYSLCDYRTLGEALRNLNADFIDWTYNDDSWYSRVGTKPTAEV
jgi:hypothetical protein